MPFVLLSASGAQHDPFTGRATSAPHTSSPETTSTETEEAHRPADERDVAPSAAEHPQVAPRADRAEEPVSPENAQARYLPDANVFVANLPTSRSDEELRHEVTKVFQRFGNCFAKVKRDHRSMPHAFVQYTDKADADAALAQGGGELIFDRKCRVESSNAHRAIYISRRDGARPVEEEIRNLLVDSGSIERIWSPTDTEKEVYSLPEGFWVKFFYWQDYSDAGKNLREHPVYRIDDRKPSKSAQALRRDSGGPPLGRALQAWDPLIHDAVGVFVGDLPSTTTEHELQKFFGSYGWITNIKLRLRPGNGFASFAYIEYAHQQSAAVAVQHLHGRLGLSNGRSARVEFKRVGQQHAVFPNTYNPWVQNGQQHRPTFQRRASNVMWPRRMSEAPSVIPYPGPSMMWTVPWAPQPPNMLMAQANSGVPSNLPAFANVPNGTILATNVVNGPQWMRLPVGPHVQAQD